MEVPILEEPDVVTGTMDSGIESTIGVDLAGCAGELVSLLDIFSLTFCKTGKVMSKGERRRWIDAKSITQNKPKYIKQVMTLFKGGSWRVELKLPI